MKCNYFYQKKKNRTSASDIKRIHNSLNEPLRTLFTKGYEKFEKEYGKNENENTEKLTT